MTPDALLQAYDEAVLWPRVSSNPAPTDFDAAYQQALKVRAWRIARGERPVGYKIGFTNRTIWERYGVYAPIWGPVWDTTSGRSPSPAMRWTVCSRARACGSIAAMN